jgi:hypothetical protein
MRIFTSIREKAKLTVISKFVKQILNGDSADAQNSLKN